MDFEDMFRWGGYEGKLVSFYEIEQNTLFFIMSPSLLQAAIFNEEEIQVHHSTFQYLIIPLDITVMIIACV